MFLGVTENQLKKYYTKLATPMLVYFVVAFGLHVIAVLKLAFIPMTVFHVLMGPLFATHALLVIGINGGVVIPASRKRPYNPARSWRYGFASLKCVPFAWRVFGLALWYAYLPMIAIYSYREDNPTGWVSIGAVAFSFVHFLAFRYVLPKRQEIIGMVGDANVS